jgi:TonB family protein
MLRELVGSRPARWIRSGPVAASAIAHAVLIAAMLMTTRGTSSHAHGRNPSSRETTPIVHVRYLTSLPIERAAPDDAAHIRERRPASTRRSEVAARQRAGAQLASLKASFDAIANRVVADVHPAVDVADVMRDIDAQDARWTAVADSEFNNRSARLSDAVRPPVPTVKDGIYTTDLVDEPVMPRPGNPKPRYPESLRAAGVEAEVSVLFVVDTTGRVDEPSIKFATHIHGLFMDAIRVSLRRARFFPARLAGSVVPQLVQQSFRFELRERP